MAWSSIEFAVAVKIPYSKIAAAWLESVAKSQRVPVVSRSCDNTGKMQDSRRHRLHRMLTALYTFHRSFVRMKRARHTVGICQRSFRTFGPVLHQLYAQRLSNPCNAFDFRPQLIPDRCGRVGAHTHFRAPLRGGAIDVMFLGHFTVV